MLRKSVQLLQAQILLLFLAVCWQSAAPCQNKNPQIFRVTARSATDSRKVNVLTGFCIDGSRGIVTALHGVIGKPTISASNPFGLVFTGLEIEAVNIDKDLALLSSPEIKRRAAIGLTIGNTPTGHANVTIVGHPYGIDQIPSFGPIRTITQLSDLIPPGSTLSAFSKRKSPAVDQIVVSLQAPLTIGLSGAPVLNSQGRVFAVSDGGLNQGATLLVWAIPLSNMNWASPTGTRYNTLKSDAHTSSLFGYDQAVIKPTLPFQTEQKDENNDIVGQKHSAVTTMSLSKSGELKATTVMKNFDNTDGLCLKPSVVFYNALGDVIYTVGTGSQWCVGSGLEKLIGGKTERTESWGGTVPQSVLDNTENIAIVQTPGSKDLIRDFLSNPDILSQLKAASKALPTHFEPSP